MMNIAVRVQKGSGDRIMSTAFLQPLQKNYPFDETGMIVKKVLTQWYHLNAWGNPVRIK
jgi:ADP-heptose:LPS heptosyltransferase